ncbi:MAG: 30S ribosomal protein S17 [Candidatus Levybacteria bacterium]|nr:30S ribosomal protein S17 [Candidatus Levybacteria bacterium]
MRKIQGFVISVNMQKTAVVNVTRKSPHPLYSKLIKKDKKIKVDIGNFTPVVGDRVKIIETKPISATKYFKIVEVIKHGTT